MATRDLFADPIWRGEELGRPIPDSPHAISVALPRWQDVVAYEEGRPDVINRLAMGYPRFVVHPLVRTLATRLGGRGPCLPFPSLRAAELCVGFIERSSGEDARIVSESSSSTPARMRSRPLPSAMWPPVTSRRCSRAMRRSSARWSGVWSG